MLPAVTWPQHPAENETDVLAFMPGEHDARRALRGKAADHVGIEFPGRGFRHAAVPHALPAALLHGQHPGIDGVGPGRIGGTGALERDAPVGGPAKRFAPLAAQVGGTAAQKAVQPAFQRCSGLDALPGQINGEQGLTAGIQLPGPPAPRHYPSQKQRRKMPVTM